MAGLNPAVVAVSVRAHNTTRLRYLSASRRGLRRFLGRLTIPGVSLHVSLSAGLLSGLAIRLWLRRKRGRRRNEKGRTRKETRRPRKETGSALVRKHVWTKDVCIGAICHRGRGGRSVPGIGRESRQKRGDLRFKKQGDLRSKKQGDLRPENSETCAPLHV